MFNANVIVGTSLNSLNQNRTFHQVVSTSSSHAGPQHTIQFQPLQSTTTSLITNQSMNPLKRKMEDDYDNPSWWRSGCKGEKINMMIVLINLLWLKSCTLIVYFSSSFVRELIISCTGFTVMCRDVWMVLQLSEGSVCSVMMRGEYPETEN